MAAVAVVLDREESWVAPVAHRADLRLVAPFVISAGPRSTPRWWLHAVLALAAVLSVAFVMSTGDGVPVSAESRGAAAVVQSVVPPAGAVAASTPGSTYTVQPGDSVWSIAAMAVPVDDVAAYVDDLVAANGGELLLVGQVLVLPVP